MDSTAKTFFFVSVVLSAVFVVRLSSPLLPLMVLHIDDGGRECDLGSLLKLFPDLSLEIG